MRLSLFFRRVPPLKWQSFRFGADYILSEEKEKTFFLAHHHLVCELHASFEREDAWLLVTQSLAVLPSGGHYAHLLTRYVTMRRGLKSSQGLPVNLMMSHRVMTIIIIITRHFAYEPVRSPQWIL